MGGFGYRFDAPPDRVVRFRRSGPELTVSAAGAAVTVTMRGCVLHAQTQAELRVPQRRC